MPPRKDPDGSVSVPCFYGAELRYKREEAGLTLEQLVEGSYRGVSFLSQIERGERRMPEDLARHVDQKLGTDGFFERRCEDARKARQVGHPSYYADIPEMEKAAATIEDWAPYVVPGLLQTEPYVRELIRAVKPWEPAAAADKTVRARLARARLWQQEERPTYWAILRESLIRNPLLPPAQMADQLEHIAEVMHSTQSVLQILPETTVGHPLMTGGLAKIMTFADAPPVVWVEADFSGEALDFPPLVAAYRKSYDRLRAAALPPEASLAMIEDAARGYRNEAQKRN
ncbi:transcriptional regulator [Streptomyces nigrescens]|uniref:Transcriptional regulator n=2 Tax=Streptomyces TaxID=1883 RepID=A0ABN6R608_STRNI|nr:helix-turn-helix transcriptional regulator [Streptomyces nigrescens]MEE4422575.1 helix-turn-helix transcriptional regulator [Streptomyces sp. DSM 41528]BDM73122.1 transcriptional regulator [Streptomyces nigrescens]